MMYVNPEFLRINVFACPYCVVLVSFFHQENHRLWHVAWYLIP